MSWIVSREFDLAWFFGGSLLSLAALALFGAGVPILILWWVWLLVFDGPHIAAAFTRTYLDPDEWRQRRGVLVRGLAVFALGPAAIVAGLVLGSDLPFQLFLGGATLYAWYHIVRQHYGFLALYRARDGAVPPLERRLETLFLYIGLWAPYVAFVLGHPRARRLVPPIPEALRVVEAALGVVIVVGWLVMLGLFGARTIARGQVSPRTAYLLLTVALYGAIYFVIARLEPVYGTSRGPDEDFLLLSVMITVFHNVQYLGLVWFHNRNRYAEPRAGPAWWVNQSLARFLGACALFAPVYWLLACWTDVFPGCRIFDGGGLGSVTAGQIGLCLWWGLALQHYYLDQKIWRVSRDPALKRHLRLA